MEAFFIFFCPLLRCRAGKAQKLGLFTQEIVPVSTKFLDSEGNETRITVTQDDGIRAGTTLEGLAKLRPAFKENGSTTAGTWMQRGHAPVHRAQCTTQTRLQVRGCSVGMLLSIEHNVLHRHDCRYVDAAWACSCP
ncbi:UNVERIFIED_CONTAM: hypothetical protein FKN15_042978 [Acipenser sinensis]